MKLYMMKEKKNDKKFHIQFLNPWYSLISKRSKVSITKPQLLHLPDLSFLNIQLFLRSDNFHFLLMSVDETSSPRWGWGDMRSPVQISTPSKCHLSEPPNAKIIW